MLSHWWALATTTDNHRPPPTTTDHHCRQPPLTTTDHARAVQTPSQGLSRGERGGTVDERAGERLEKETERKAGGMASPTGYHQVAGGMAEWVYNAVPGCQQYSTGQAYVRWRAHGSGLVRRTSESKRVHHTQAIACVVAGTPRRVNCVQPWSIRPGNLWCSAFSAEGPGSLFHHSVTVSCHGPQVLSHMLRNATFQRRQWMRQWMRRLWTVVP